MRTGRGVGTEHDQALVTAERLSSPVTGKRRMWCSHVACLNVPKRLLPPATFCAAERGTRGAHDDKLKLERSPARNRWLQLGNSNVACALLPALMISVDLQNTLKVLL